MGSQLEKEPVNNWKRTSYRNWERTCLTGLTDSQYHQKQGRVQSCGTWVHCQYPCCIISWCCVQKRVQMCGSLVAYSQLGKSIPLIIMSCKQVVGNCGWVSISWRTAKEGTLYAIHHAIHYADVHQIRVFFEYGTQDTSHAGIWSGLSVQLFIANTIASIKSLPCKYLPTAIGTSHYPNIETYIRIRHVHVF